jgi:hypothetical protein
VVAQVLRHLRAHSNMLDRGKSKAVRKGLGTAGFDRIVNELVRLGYITPHPNRHMLLLGQYRITLKGVARADAG